eukprot:NODE_56_length_28873_cov_1.243101.p2 type:complete len:1374 gc:universal NODE_56_length_28873_cov_1.243101:20592-24713(+)
MKYDIKAKRYLYIYLGIAILCNVLTGVVGPVFQIYFGQVIEKFITTADSTQDLTPLLYMIALGCFNFMIFYIGKIVLLVNFDVGKIIRLKLSHALLLKDMDWYTDMEGKTYDNNDAVTNAEPNLDNVPILQDPPTNPIGKRNNNNIFDFGVENYDSEKIKDVEREEKLKISERGNKNRLSQGFTELHSSDKIVEEKPLLKQPDFSKFPEMPPELKNQLPPGFDISKMPPIPQELLKEYGLPPNFDINNPPPIPQHILSKLPSDFDINQLPPDFDVRDIQTPLRTPTSPKVGKGKDGDKNALGVPSLLASVGEIEQIGTVLCELVNAITTVIASFSIAFLFDYKTTLVQLSVIPLMLMLGIIVMVYYQKIGFLETEYKAKASHILGDAITNITTIMTFNCQDYIYSQYEEQLLKILKLAKISCAILGFTAGAFMFIMYGITGLSLYFASIQVENHVLTVAQSITIFTVILGAFGALGKIPMSIQGLSKGMGAWKRLKPVMQFEEKAPLRQLEDFKGEIEFKNVSFKYPNRDEYALKDVSFFIPSGHNVAFVGESGSGKSTCLNLLLKYYDYEGQILIDGVDLRSIDEVFLREKFGLVEQNPKLFNMTIIQNIILPYGIFGSKVEPQYMDLAIYCCERAFAHDFITKFPDGYFTLVGEKGVTMSQGQKQRIAIARSLVKSPQVLLFDEATSALDALSEEIVQQTIDDVKEGRTCIQVSHRISSIKNCQEIFVFKDGLIVEFGTFDALCDDKGYFYELVQGQTINQISPTSAKKRNVSVFNDLEVDSEITEKGKSKINFTKIYKESKIRNPVFKYLAKQIYHRPYMFTFGLVGSFVFGMIMPLSGYLFSSIIGYLGHPEFRQQINEFCLYYLYIAVVAFVGLGTTFFFLTYLSVSFSTKFLPAIFRSLLYADMAYYDDPTNSSSQLQSRIEEDLQRIELASGNLIAQVLQNTVTFVGGFIFALLVSPIIGAICCIFLLALSIGSYFTSNVAKRYNDLLVLKKIEASGLVADCLGNIRILRSLNCHDFILQQYDDLIESQRKLVLYMLFVIGLFDGLISSLREFLFPLIFYIGYILMNYKIITGPQLIQPLFIILMSSSSVDSLLGSYRTFLQTTDSAARFFELLEQKPNIDLLKSGEKPVDIQGDAQFQNVSFQYLTRQEPAITDANLHIQHGDRIGIVGGSGSGKTTIAKLLLRLYDPDQGNVLMECVNAKDWDVHYLRSNVLFISRDGVFRDTIKNNILLGATPTELDQVLKAVNLYKWIQDLPFKADTMIDANSVSGGQLQRLLMARILIRKPKILILDEALSALDQENEEFMMELLDQMNCSIVIISHKLSSVEKCDRIYVVENGEIVEQGTHNDLYRKRGSYYKLASLQEL